MDSIDLTIIGILVCSALIFVLWVTVETDYEEVKKRFGLKLTATDAKDLTNKAKKRTKDKILDETLERIRTAAERGEDYIRISGLWDYEKEELEKMGFKITRVSSMYQNYIIEW